jgi:hypothetical protein
MKQSKSARKANSKKLNAEAYKMYLIHFGEISKSFTPTHNKLRTKLFPEPWIIDWRRYGSQSYFVIVDSTAMAFDVAISFRNFLPRKRFLIMELNIDNRCSFNTAMCNWFSNLKSKFGF